MKIKAGVYSYIYRNVTFVIKQEMGEWHYVIYGKISKPYYAKKVAVAEAKCFIDNLKNS